MDAHDGRNTRDRILALLREGPATADQLGAGLVVTKTAVRLQLAGLERDGLVSRRGVRRGRTKPSVVYELTARGEESLSAAYLPMLTHLLQVLSGRLAPEEFGAVMREVGRSMIDRRPRPAGAIRERVEAARRLFNELGGLTTVEHAADGLIIRSHGCPLAATTARHPEACLAAESLFHEFIGAPVSQCCEREERLRCCFAVEAEESERAAAGRGNAA